MGSILEKVIVNLLLYMLVFSVTFEPFVWKKAIILTVNETFLLKP